MICRVSGILEGFTARGVELQVGGGQVWEVLLTASERQALRAKGRGEQLTFHTIFFLEGQVGGGSLQPMLLGFRSEVEREFFQLFTTVKNIGVAKALKALTLPSCEVARAIEESDLRLLATLKGIGEKTARQVVAELTGKVGKFALQKSEEGEKGQAEAAPEEEAREVLMQLGYSQAEARRMVDGALEKGGRPASTEELIERIYRLQASGTGVNAL